MEQITTEEALMPNRITEPSLPADAYSQGDTVIGVRLASPGHYDEIGRQQSGLPPRGAREVIQPAAPTEAPLPMSGVANAVVGKELSRLREQATQLERSIQSPPVGPGGYQVDHLVSQRQQMRADLELLHEEIARIETLDDGQVRAFAYKLGAR
jgi:hypothetical protein